MATARIVIHWIDEEFKYRAVKQDDEYIIVEVESKDALGNLRWTTKFYPEEGQGMWSLLMAIDRNEYGIGQE